MYMGRGMSFSITLNVIWAQIRLFANFKGYAGVYHGGASLTSSPRCAAWSSKIFIGGKKVMVVLCSSCFLIKVIEKTIANIGCINGCDC